MKRAPLLPLMPPCRSLNPEIDCAPRNIEEASMIMEKLDGVDKYWVKTMGFIASRWGIMCAAMYILPIGCFAWLSGVVLPNTMREYPAALTFISRFLVTYSVIFLFDCIACANFQRSKTLWWFIAYNLKEPSDQGIIRRDAPGILRSWGLDWRFRVLGGMFCTSAAMLAFISLDLSLVNPHRTCVVVITMIFISAPVALSSMFGQYLELVHSLAQSPGQDLVQSFQKASELLSDPPDNTVGDKIAPDFWRLSLKAFRRIEANVPKLYEDVSLFMACHGAGMLGASVFGLALLMGHRASDRSRITGAITCFALGVAFYVYLREASRVSALYSSNSSRNPRMPPTVQSALRQIMGTEPASQTSDLFHFASYLRDSNVGAHVFSVKIGTDFGFKFGAAGSVLLYAVHAVVRQMGFSDDHLEIVINGTSYTCYSA